MSKSTANRGMSFEKLIEDKCEDLQKKKLALIHKVPTEWKVIRNYNPITKQNKIHSAFPVSESRFVDFVGVCNSKPIAIEAKETNEETRFPFDNIKDSQISFMNLWCELGGKGYYIIHFKKHKKIFWVSSKDMHDCINNIGRKSAPYKYFLGTKEVVELNYNKINFEDYIY